MIYKGIIEKFLKHIKITYIVDVLIKLDTGLFHHAFVTHHCV